MAQEPLDILKQYWGYEQFRPLQEDIIRSVLDGKATLALLPTGGGKSICFQVPAIITEGLCLVISPLIALMKDQVESLNSRGIKAVALHSGMTSREQDITLDNCVYGNFKFLYISPERLTSPIFRERAEKLQIGMIAIDEAHCISQWGYDFRPPYLEIGVFIREFGIQKSIAVTATATKKVKADIIDKLGFTEAAVFVKSFARLNLSYSVFRTERKHDKLLEVLNGVPGSAIVYVRSRKRTKMICDFLMSNGIESAYYHAGLTTSDRNSKQERWIENNIRVMVATNAFGMGIDKPDVRTVIHLDLPDTLEAYYQEAGRAGRDNRKAYAVLLYHDQDVIDLRKRIERSAVGMDLIKRTYQALANQYKLAVGSGADSSFDFEYSTFVQTFNLPVFETYHALKKLDGEGLIHLNDGVFQRSRIHIEIDHEELYKFQVAHANLDSLIKAILRLYGGELYLQFVDIREGDIARLLNSSKSEVVRRLEMLQQFGVIEYHKATSKPQVDFITPRLDVNNLPIDSAHLEWRKNIVLEKYEKVAEYIGDTSRCRTRILQSYFDEETDHNCGVCDYCINFKKSAQKLSPSAILDAIPDRGINVDELVLLMSTDRETVLDGVRALIEDGRIKVLGDRHLLKN